MSVETEPEYTLEFSNDHNETYVTNRGYRWKLDLARAYQDTRVIIVNENPQFGELATREFARRGISRAYTVTSVDDAITQVRNHPDSVNLLVLYP